MNDERNDDTAGADGVATAMDIKDAAPETLMNTLEKRLKAVEDAVGDLSEWKARQVVVSQEKDEYRSEAEGRLRCLRDLFSLIYKLECFRREHFQGGKQPAEDDVKRLETFVNTLLCKAKDVLDQSGVRMVAPMRNDAVSREEHDIIGTVSRTNESDVPGRVAECAAIGYWRHNHVIPSEVYVFSEEMASDVCKQ